MMRCLDFRDPTVRIAFASCMCTPYFSDQPVWNWIAAKQPDHVVLLGDSIYLDVARGVDTRSR